jgi:hypothetical protein
MFDSNSCFLKIIIGMKIELISNIVGNPTNRTNAFNGFIIVVSERTAIINFFPSCSRKKKHRTTIAITSITTNNLG